MLAGRTARTAHLIVPELGGIQAPGLGNPMPVPHPGAVVTADPSLLRSLRQHDHPGLGIRERFLQPTVGDGRTVAVLATPLGDPLPHGWLLCHSFGMEEFYMQAVEVAAARRLAAAGFRVLRFHAQGYGDSDGPTEEASLGSQVRDAVDALAELRAAVGTGTVGLLGGRVGGAVAAVAGDRGDADALVLWDPMVDGAAYAQSLLRMSVVSELAQRGRSGGVARDPAEALAADGVLDVQGFPLGEPAFRELSSFDLCRELRTFSGVATVAQLSRSSTPRRPLRRLVDRLEELGANASLDVLAHPEAPLFGQQRFRISPDGVKRDTQAGLSDAMLAWTVQHCDRAFRAVRGLVP
jgi:pimeloyl-ACP methyl ester carboxylesterase